MSCHVNEIIAEGLMDEFYEDPFAAIKWLEEVCNQDCCGLSEDQLVELFVNESMSMMA